MRKPLLLLDIDGCLCPFEEHPGLRWEKANGCLVLMDPATPERLAILSEHFTLVWCSSWEYVSNSISELFNLPDLPVVPMVHTDSSMRTWKLNPVDEFVNPETQLAWLDDELGADADLWAERREPATKLVRTNPDTGITDADVAELVEFATSL